MSTTQLRKQATLMGVPFPALLKLLQLLMGHQLPLLRVLLYMGLLLLPVSLVSWAWSRNAAFGFAIYAWITCLVFPYMFAVTTQRSLIASRRLALVPRFPLASGLALLSIAVLLSTTLPLAMWLYGLPLPAGWFLPRIFVLASAYAAIVQLCVISRLGPLLLSSLPFVLIVLLNRYQQVLGVLWADPLVIAVLFLACATGWYYALRQLAHGTAFRRPFYQDASLGMSGDSYHQQQHATQWLPATGTTMPQATLLHGFHASLQVRLVYFLQIMVISPLFVALAMIVIGDRAFSQSHYWSLVLMVHGFMVATYPWSWGELAARTRLLWLKWPGTRRELWYLLQAELRSNFALMFSLTLLLSVVALLANTDIAQHYLHVLAVVVATGLHNAYMSLLARMHHWPGWLQGLAASTMAGVIALTLIAGFQMQSSGPAWILSAILLLLGFLYQWRCKRAFFAVDWLRLKPLTPARKGPAAV